MPTTKTQKPKPAAGATSARNTSTSAAPSSMDRTVRPGFISHTELASGDPAATKKWCEQILGWKFGPSMPMPDGSQYHMWAFNDNTGGGIRGNNAPEPPGAIPYCEVNDIKGTFTKAVKAGAKEMMQPTEIPGGMGWIAVVHAPGGVPMGFWAPTA